MSDLIRFPSPQTSFAMAVEAKPEPGDLLRRPSVPYSSLPELSKPFLIDPSKRSFKYQYANVYFVRLVELRPIVEEHAKRLWAERHCRSITPEQPDPSQTSSSPAHPRPQPGSAMLHCRHCLHGHAPEA